MLKRFIISLVQTYPMLMIIPVGLGILVQFADPELGGMTIFKSFMLAPFFHIVALGFSAIVALLKVIFGKSGGSAENAGASGFQDVGGGDSGSL